MEGVYSMQLKLEHLDIKIGQHKVLLNIVDAKELGVNPGDRVRIRGHESLSAIVDTTDDMVPPGTLGAVSESYRHFKDWDKPVEVVPAFRPDSTTVIKKI